MRHVFIGYDPRDDLAYKVAERSLYRHAKGINVHMLKDRDLRRQGIYGRPYRVDHVGQMWDERDGRPFSTEFSFTRFAVPLLCKRLADDISGPVLFIDADVMFRADVNELFDLWDDTKALMCIQHNQKVHDETKMDGVIQNPNTHGRKNWSSVMLMDWERCLANGTDGLNPYRLNTLSGAQLHSFTWLPDQKIGALPEEWNYLVHYSDPMNIQNPKLVHYTDGTPDMGVDGEFLDEWWAYAKQGPK